MGKASPLDGAFLYFREVKKLIYMEKKLCHNCGEEIREGLIKTNFEREEQVVMAYNKILGYNKLGYCDKCSKPIEMQVKEIRKKCESVIDSNIEFIPIVTTHVPLDWKYRVGGIITGQSVIGTGVISEFKSSFSDFFGLKSNSFISKIAEGEKDCFYQLRMKALKLGCNAIIATDIDYGELGSLKGMIMVCAAGTAVKVENTDI